MIKEYFPTQYVESVFAIDYEALYKRGYRGIVFDIDNTMVPHGMPSTPEVDALVAHIQQVGFSTVFLSNNTPERIEEFLENIDSPYVSDAEKPEPEGFLKAVEVLSLPKDQVIVVGDTTFTDIVGANRSGLDSVLVKFIGYYTETKLGVHRRIEKAILWAYRHSRYCNRLGIIEREEVR